LGSDNFVPIEGNSKNYHFALTIFAIFTVVGMICFGFSYFSGHHIFGSSNVVPWGMPIVLAIFLIGLSAGLHILAFLIYIMKQDQYRQVIKVAVYLAVVLIFGAMLAIAIDLGRPEKFWRLFMLFYMNNMTSMFAINSIFYSCYLLSAVIYLASLLGNMKKFSIIMGMIAFGWAMLTHGGTGAIFGFIYARETWFSPLSPFEFIMAAFVSSIALLTLVILLLFKLTKRRIDWSLIGSLQGLTKAFLIGLILLMVVGELTHLYSTNRDAIMYMLTGHYSWLFWVFQIFLGILIPLFLLFYKKTRNNPSSIIFSSIFIVIGIFFKRFYLVVPGAAYPLHFYPGHIEGVYGVVGKFPITLAEIGLSIGILSFLVFLFLLGLKYLEVMPPKIQEKQSEEIKSEALPSSNPTSAVT